MFQDIDDEVERDGFTLRARIEHDEHTGAPWEEHDGHGPLVLGYEPAVARYYGEPAA